MALEFKSGLEDRSSAAGLHPIGWHGDGYAGSVHTPAHMPAHNPLISVVSVPKPVAAFELDLQEALPEVPSSRFPPPVPFHPSPPAASMFSPPPAHPPFPFHPSPPAATMFSPPPAYRVAAAGPRNTSFFTQVTRAGAMTARGRKRPIGGWPY